MKSLEKSLTDGNQRAESCNRRNRSIVRYQSCGNIKQGVVALGVVANVGWQSCLGNNNGGEKRGRG